MANQANYEVAGGSSPVIAEENVENLESSCASSTCGDTTSSNSSECAGGRVSINEQSLNNNDSAGGADRVITGGSNHSVEQAESCSALVLHPNAANGNSAGDVGGPTTRENSLRDNPSNMPASAASSPSELVAPEPISRAVPGN